MNARLGLFVLAVLALLAVEVLSVWLVMPLPGSQTANTISVAYLLVRHGWVLRVVALLAMLPALYEGLRNGGAWMRVALAVLLLVYGGIFAFTNFVMKADRMFLKPRHTVLAPASDNRVPLERLVVGVEHGGESHAFPLELIGYHHQVEDVVGGQPVLVTYCTVCRTGRVYDPVVDGRPESFRLVGMDHWNAMFEDATTHSWWRQVTGQAIAGPRKGARLAEVPSEQTSLREWLARHPDSKILQPDPDFVAEYAGLRGFDDGTRGGALTGRNAGSWQRKSWIVGVVAGDAARAYDWNDLVRVGVINDVVGGVPIVLWTGDGASFTARGRGVGGRVLTFARDTSHTLRDTETQSAWNEDGACIAGPLRGERLPFVTSSQEFWHSWRQFHPQTDTYRPPRTGA